MMTCDFWENGIFKEVKTPSFLIKISEKTSFVNEEEWEEKIHNSGYQHFFDIGTRDCPNLKFWSFINLKQDIDYPYFCELRDFDNRIIFFKNYIDCMEFMNKFSNIGNQDILNSIQDYLEHIKIILEERK